MNEREVNVLYTGMPATWSDEECIYEMVRYLKYNGAPMRDTIADIHADMDSKVIKVTITVEDRTLTELLEDRQHRN